MTKIIGSIFKNDDGFMLNEHDICVCSGCEIGAEYAEKGIRGCEHCVQQSTVWGCCHHCNESVKDYESLTSTSTCQSCGEILLVNEKDRESYQQAIIQACSEFCSQYNESDFYDRNQGSKIHQMIKIYKCILFDWNNPSKIKIYYCGLLICEFSDPSLEFKSCTYEQLFSKFIHTSSHLPIRSDICVHLLNIYKDDDDISKIGAIFRTGLNGDTYRCVCNNNNLESNLWKIDVGCCKICRYFAKICGKCVCGQIITQKAYDSNHYGHCLCDDCVEQYLQNDDHYDKCLEEILNICGNRKFSDYFHFMEFLLERKNRKGLVFDYGNQDSIYVYLCDMHIMTFRKSIINIKHLDIENLIANIKTNLSWSNMYLFDMISSK